MSRILTYASLALVVAALPGCRAPEQALLGRMTAEEKFWQLYAVPDSFGAGRDRFRPGIFGLQIRAGATAAEHAARINEAQRFFRDSSRLGIPIIPFEEALHGVVAPGATVFPQAIGLAATWDTALMARVAGAIAAEARSRGIRQVLGPVVNIATDVRWGRVEETYGEDPLLASAMALAWVRPFEAAGVLTTPKHFVANVGDGGRDSWPIGLGERALRDIHFPPFEAAIRLGGAGSIMAAYNSVNGLPATASPWLLQDVLRRQWGFQGFVLGDAGATGGANVLHRTARDYTESTAAAVNAGLDVLFQTSWEQHGLFQEAFTRGLVPARRVEEAVTRVLRAKTALGLFREPLVDTAMAARVNGSEEHRQLALEAARSSLVLLRNEAGALPLRHGIPSVAVIGVDAAEPRFGGYSGPGVAPVSILDGLRAVAGPGTEVRYAPGPGRTSDRAVTVPATAFGAGLTLEGFEGIAPAGAPRFRRTVPSLDASWTIAPPDSTVSIDWYSVRWSGSLAVPPGGAMRLGVEGNDGYRLWLDDKLVLDRWQKQSAGRRYLPVPLGGGSRHRLRVEFFETAANGRLRLVWEPAQPSDASERIRAAAELARRSAAALVVVGIEEGEFRDRSSLALPGHQEALIEAVAATGTPTVVVIVGGSAVTMPWLERVAAVLEAWYPGEMGGRAAAEALFGEVNPSGRLPLTFPEREGQLPLVYNHEPTGRGDDYLDGTGQGLFPFGFGLSYTTFEYSGLAIEGGTVRFRVRNSGRRAGAEVAQIYVRPEVSRIVQPVMALAGFQRVALAAGEERELRFTLPDRPELAPGPVGVMVGSSSRDIRLRGMAPLPFRTP